MHALREARPAASPPMTLGDRSFCMQHLVEFSGILHTCSAAPAAPVGAAGRAACSRTHHRLHTHAHIRISHLSCAPYPFMHPSEPPAHKSTRSRGKSKSGSPRSGGPSTREGAPDPPPEGPGRAWRMARSSSSSSSSSSSEEPPPGPLLGMVRGWVDLPPFSTGKIQWLQELTVHATMLMVSAEPNACAPTPPRPMQEAARCCSCVGLRCFRRCEAMGRAAVLAGCTRWLAADCERLRVWERSCVCFVGLICVAVRAEQKLWGSNKPPAALNQAISEVGPPFAPLPLPTLRWLTSPPFQLPPSRVGPGSPPPCCGSSRNGWKQRPHALVPPSCV